MPGFAHFLRCIANAVVKNGGRALAGLVPFGDVLYEIATSAYEDYRKDRGEPELRAELQGLAQATPAEVHQIAEQVAAKEPAEVRLALVSYLQQLPAAIHQSLRRPSDPGGTTILPGRSLSKPEDLLAFLPAELPRFKPGDQPLAADWELVEMLGKGGFGEVWKARHLMRTMQKPVALKFCLDPIAARSLRNEATLHDLLDRVRQQGGGRGIVPLLETYFRADPPCLMYELIEGGALTGLIQELHQQGKLTPKGATQIVHRLASIVAFAHGLNPPLVHRDLKPSNVLVRREEDNKIRLFVADFGIGGLAARQSLQEQASRRSVRSQTLPTAVRGAYTPLYASPQQVQGDRPDPRDDVHALGVIWYQLVTGDLKLMSIPPDWRDVVEERGLGEEQIRLMASCIAGDLKRRLTSAAELSDRLTALREQDVERQRQKEERSRAEAAEMARLAAEQRHREQEEEAARREEDERQRREAARAQEETAQRERQEEAQRQEQLLRHEQEEAERLQREETERKQREQEEAARREEQERRQQEEDARCRAEDERRQREIAIAQAEAEQQRQEAERQEQQKRFEQEQAERQQEEAGRRQREQEEAERREDERRRRDIATRAPDNDDALRLLSVREIEIGLRGKWLARPANDPQAPWTFVCRTPRRVSIRVDEVYRLQVVRSTKDDELAGLTHLRSLTALQELDLRGCKKVTDAGLAHLSGLTALGHLHLGECNKVTDAGLAHLSGLMALQELDLERCGRVTDAGLPHLRNLPALKHLHLPCCIQVTDKGLAHLRGLVTLQELDLGECNKVTDAGLAHIQGLTALQELHLNGCDLVTDVGLAHLSGLTSLQGLYLSGCKVTDAGLAHLSSLVALQELDLTGCKVSDAGLAHLRGLTSLQGLYLDGCEQVTDGGMSSLLQEVLRGAQRSVPAEQAQGMDEASRQEKSVPKALPSVITNSIGMRFALIPAGVFLMGSPDSEADRGGDEGPVHEVRITQPFYLGVFPVTQEQYQQVMGNNPSYFSATGKGKDRVRGLDTRSFPVECVSWEDAQTFLERLSALPQEKGRQYRLPTEAEWEYSCRGGATYYQIFHFGNSLSSKQANFDGNYPYGGAEKGPYLNRTCQVGSYQANAFGLFDMHGNVWEWCADRYGSDYYGKSPRHWTPGCFYASCPREDPPGPAGGAARVIRGGSWDGFGLSAYSGSYCRSASRYTRTPAHRSYNLGFRLVLFPLERA